MKRLGFFPVIATLAALMIHAIIGPAQTACLANGSGQVDRAVSFANGASLPFATATLLSSLPTAIGHDASVAPRDYDAEVIYLVPSRVTYSGDTTAQSFPAVRTMVSSSLSRRNGEMPAILRETADSGDSAAQYHLRV